MITVNAFLIPLSLSGYGEPAIRMGIIFFIITAATSIFFAIMSLMPKRYKADSEGNCNLLHFSGIWQYDEATYKALMREALESRLTITELMVSDIYHLSNDVLRPKFRFIRMSFYVFLFSMTGSILLIVIPLALQN